MDLLLQLKKIVISNIFYIVSMFFYSYLEYRKGKDGKKENSYLELLINNLFFWRKK